MRFAPRFPFVVAACAWAVLIAFRLFAAASVDGASSGFLYGLFDNLSYVSWIQQTAHGSFFLSDLYTTDPHAPIYFNPLFALVGLAARVTGATPSAMLIAWGAAAYPLTVLSCYYLARLSGLSERAARWSCALAAFGAGLSGPGRPLAAALNTLPPLGADAYHHDAFIFQTAYAYPFQAITSALLGALLVCVAWIERRREARQPAAAGWLLAGVLALVLAGARPYEATMLLASYGGYGLYVVLRQSRLRAFPPATGLLTVAIVPFLTYAAWLSTQPVWSDFASTSLDLLRPRSYWLLGYGLLLPAALVGAWHVFRTPGLNRARGLAVWVCLLFGLLLVVHIRQVKITSGGALPVCVLAGLGCDRVCAAALARAPVSAHGRIRGLLAALAVFFFATPPWLLAHRFTARAYSDELPAAARRIAGLSQGTTPVVLCAADDGNVLPALHPIRVYAGHFALTPGWEWKKQSLLDAGFGAPTSPGTGGGPTTRAFEALVRECAPDYLLLATNSAAFSFARASRDMELIAVYGQRGLFIAHRTPGKQPDPGAH